MADARRYPVLPLQRRLLAAGALLALAALAGPQAVRGAEAEDGDLKECMDDSWGDYNACLMESSSTFSRWLCDIYFQADVVLCGAIYAGEIRKAYDGGMK